MLFESSIAKSLCDAVLGMLPAHVCKADEVKRYKALQEKPINYMKVRKLSSTVLCVDEVASYAFG